MREFTTAVTAESERLEGIEETIGSPVTWKIDGRETTFHPPHTSQIAMVLSLDGAGTKETIAGFLNFFFSLLGEKDQAHYRKRLWSREDPFGVVMIRDISAALIEEWSARPTQSPSGSSASRRTSGGRSTAKRPSKA